jgi:hypothetical protein
MSTLKTLLRIALVATAASLASDSTATADAILDWNQKACEIVVGAKLTPASATRVLAIAETAAYEAANAITKRYPATGLKLDASSGASVEAAVAAANQATLAKLLPSQQTAIDEAYQTALAAMPNGPGKTEGIGVGTKAAEGVLASRTEDLALADKAESYRPITAAGVYISTTIPIASQWPERKPWLMAKADQLRPGPPSDLKSDLWARDYNEIKAVGSRGSTQRTIEQTAIAHFWDATQPSIYHGLVRTAANAPGREITRNARLLAAFSQALDDAYMAVFDAKYHYNFWRPITAIRNGDIDGNDGTERDASWTPLIETPMHPEYPCAHCILSGAAAVVLQAEFSAGPVPTWTTTSPTVNGAPRSWATLDDFVREVANARIYGGVHYRNSTEVGTAMGRKVGALAVAKFLARPN